MDITLLVLVFFGGMVTAWFLDVIVRLLTDKHNRRKEDKLKGIIS